jgi:ribonucleotide monophosphatase NagD (HAD superfamily)
VANPDLVAPRETGLSKEPGYFAHLLTDSLGLAPDFFGKPFGDAYEDALERLPGVSPSRVAMVGDTLHTDILGGKSAGLLTVLVRDHGLFAGKAVADYVTRSGITPDFQCGSI